MAVATALAARDQQLVQPDHVVSAYPVAQTGLDTENHTESAEAMPLSRAMMEWLFDKTVTDESQLGLRISPVDADLANLPPVTIINAELDPLRSDGTMLVEAIEAAGSPVEQRTFDGVIHEFFGKATVVDAAAAQDYAIEPQGRSDGTMPVRVADRGIAIRPPFLPDSPSGRGSSSRTRGHACRSFLAKPLPPPAPDRRGRTSGRGRGRPPPHVSM